jgi:hypothetical protein
MSQENMLRWMDETQYLDAGKYVVKKSVAAGITAASTRHCPDCLPEYQTYGGDHIQHWDSHNKHILGNDLQFCEGLFHVFRCPEFDVTVTKFFFVFNSFIFRNIARFMACPRMNAECNACRW